MVNVYTLRDTNKGYRLGSTREVKLEEILHRSLKSIFELNDFINEGKRLQNENTNIISYNTQKDIFIAGSKAEIATKSKKIRSLESMIKILEGKLASAQKDTFSSHEDLLKKESEILSLKSKIAEVEQIKSSLTLKINRRVDARSSEKIDNNRVSAKAHINRFCINLKKSKYLKNPKSILGTCIVPDHTGDEITLTPSELEIQRYTSLPKADIENIIKISDEINISKTSKDIPPTHEINKYFTRKKNMDQDRRVDARSSEKIDNNRVSAKAHINRFCINLKKSKYLKNPKSILGTCIVPDHTGDEITLTPSELEIQRYTSLPKADIENIIKISDEINISKTSKDIPPTHEIKYVTPYLTQQRNDTPLCKGGRLN
ncbi:hypothetical protein Glove_460g26 [Diversispora epigaea]|uniref:Uncharacterized protein n=1 Tax=Diversispora epigaea TaxID=1348612 RepID=A0A397GSQ7_9GLOM|nr:hypothetical protein Glove_460g26 [Diversispora epigaea]